MPNPEIEDITITKCPKACSEAGCVISGKFYCAHPAKGGLQHDAAHDLAAHDRVAQARKIVGLDRPPLKRDQEPQQQEAPAQ